MDIYMVGGVREERGGGQIYRYRVLISFFPDSVARGQGLDSVLKGRGD